MLLPALIAIFGGGLPILFDGDVRLSLFIILIFLGLGTILLLIRVGIARDAIIFTLGGSLIINPTKFFMTKGLSMTHFGGLPVPFVSLTDLAMIALLWSELAKGARGPISKLPRPAAILLLVWIVSMASSLIGANYPGIGFWHMTFEWKCILLFFTISWLGLKQSSSAILGNMRILFYGLATGIYIETLAVLAEHLNVIGSGFSFLGIQIGGFNETLGGITATRAGGTYRHPNYLAIPMAALLVPFVTMTLRTRGLSRLFFGGAATCAILNLLLTLSRGGWLAATVPIFIFLCLLATTSAGLTFLKRNRRCILSICIFGFFTIVALSGTIMHKIFDSADTNISSRMVLNEMAIEMIKDHPLSGVGLNNSVDASNSYNLRKQFEIHLGIPPVIHNIYLLVGAEVGILGVLALVTFILCLLIQGLTLGQQRIDEGDIPFFLAALSAGGFAYLTADMFGPGLRKLEISYLFWCHLGMVTLLANSLLCMPAERSPGGNNVP